MQTRQKRLYIYSIFWGVVSFGAGLLTTLSTLPSSLSVQNVEDWKVAAWVWLNAHGTPISKQAVSDSPFATGSLNFIPPNPELHMLRVLPLFTAAIACLLLVNSMNGFRKDTELFNHGVLSVMGYLTAGFVTVVVSNARPEIASVAGTVALFGAAAYTGSAVATRLRVPVFAVTSLGGLAVIGLLFFLGVGAVAAIVVPMAKYAAVGALGAVCVLWVGDNLDI